MAKEARNHFEVKLHSHFQDPVVNHNRMSVSEFHERYLDDCRVRQLSKNTLATIKFRLISLKKRIGDIYITDISKEILQKYFNDLIADKRQILGINVDYRHLRAAFNWAVDQECGLVNYNFLSGKR